METLPLKNIKVLELEGLAPTVFTGMFLKDYGADVTIIGKSSSQSVAGDIDTTYLNRGKKSIVMDLKKQQDKQNFIQMCKQADVLIDCYRPGVLEKLGLGPEILQKLNPRIIICRITGYGQTGPFKDLAGHDINYISQSGMLSVFGKEGQPHPFPGNMLADFGGGGNYGVIGILMALYQRSMTGKGQVVDIAMHEAVGYMGAFIDAAYRNGIWSQPPGKNTLDGGAHFYRCYMCKCGGQMAVGSTEPKFYAGLLKGLGIDRDQFEDKFGNQFAFDQWPAMQKYFEELFLQKTRDEWAQIFYPLDCCVTPVLTMPEAQSSQLWKKRGSLVNGDQFGPHPKFSGFKNIEKSGQSPKRGQHTEQVLREYGIKPKL